MGKCRKILSILPLLLLASLIACPPAAAELGQEVDLGLRVSSLGVGADLGLQVHPKVRVRFNVNGFWWSYDHSYQDIDYDIKLNWLTLGGLVDYHPLNTGFRITGGAYINLNKLNLDTDIDPTATYNIGGQTFTGAQVGTLDGDIKWNVLSPYLGIGWTTPISPNRRWMFYFDLGVIYHGQAEVSLDSSNPLGLAELSEALKREEKDIEDDLSGFQFYPVVGVGFSYLF